MKIVLARIDDRLIHGQVATVWSKATDCQRIIVCDDEVAKDKIRAVLLKQLAPAGVKSHVVDLAKAVRIYRNPKYENDRCLLLFTNPTSVLYLVEHGVPIKSVNNGFESCLLIVRKKILDIFQKNNFGASHLNNLCNINKNSAFCFILKALLQTDAAKCLTWKPSHQNIVAECLEVFFEFFACYIITGIFVK